MEVLNRMSPYLQIAETGREVAAAFILCGQTPFLQLDGDHGDDVLVILRMIMMIPFA